MKDDVEWAPVSVVMKDNSRLLGFGDLQGDIILLRGAIEYHIEFRNGDTSTHLREYDPATDDEYIVLRNDDIFCVNNMSDDFLNMYMAFHHKKATLDFESFGDGANIVLGNFGVAH
jgi:hypothetical protein